MGNDKQTTKLKIFNYTENVPIWDLYFIIGEKLYNSNSVDIRKFLSDFNVTELMRDSGFDFQIDYMNKTESYGVRVVQFGLWSQSGTLPKAVVKALSNALLWSENNKDGDN